ncbi:hypothetical protein TNCV_2367641 [Trichonephila clavipes]|nr:hypothetical protein TNCV_2367641 [Trichonephila clavipes]
MSSITKLNRKWGNLKAQINKLLTFEQSENVADISAHLSVLAKIQKKFEDLKMEYYETAKEEEIDEIKSSLAATDSILQDLQKPNPRGEQTPDPVPHLGEMAMNSGEKMVSDADCCAVGLGSIPGENLDVCKCIVPSWHGGTLNSRRVDSPLVRLVAGNESHKSPETACKNEQSAYPLASSAALSDFHVDDILTGVDNVVSAIELQQQLISMLKSGAQMVLQRKNTNGTSSPS